MKTPLHIAAAKENIDVVILFVENGAVADWKDLRGKRPIDIAFEAGFYKGTNSIVKYFL